jgi:hypothetical protein
MLRRVALVRTYVSEERIASIIKVLASSFILVILMMEAIRSSETSVFTIAATRNITEDAILHSHDSENLKFFKLRFCS